MICLEDKLYIPLFYSRKVSYWFIHVYKVCNKLKINLCMWGGKWSESVSFSEDKV